MHLRDLFVFAIVAFTVPTALRTPFVGLLTFSWLAYMRPQDLCWGFAKTARFSYLVAFAMIVGFLVHEWRRQPFARWDVRTKIMVLLAIIMGATIPFARDQGAYVYNRYIEFCKIIMIALFTAGQVNSRHRLRLVMWVITVSLGFYGVKNGLFGVLKGGAPINRGPGGMLYDNNDFALALVMVIPMLYYLGTQETKLWIKRATKVAIVMTVFAILLTHSRGGFLSLCAVMTLFWWRSQKKMFGVVVVLLGLAAFFTLTPQHVFDRILSIGAYEQDSSARGRLMAWGVAFGMIEDFPVFGVGLHNFRPHFLDYIDFEISWAPVAHNSYLQIWAEGGTVSFVLYVTMIGSCFWTFRKLRLLGQRTEGGEWIFNYARMFEASFVGFVCGAMFLNRGHFDLVYHMIGCVTAFNIVALRWAAQPVGQREGDDVSDERQPIRVGPPPEAGTVPATTFIAPRARRPIWGR